MISVGSKRKNSESGENLCGFYGTYFSYSIVVPEKKLINLWDVPIRPMCPYHILYSNAWSRSFMENAHARLP